MGPSESGAKYLLLIKDYLLSYVSLIPSSVADAATVIDALTEWFAAFGVVRTWV
jgi:hypothetical protein